MKWAGFYTKAHCTLYRREFAVHRSLGSITSTVLYTVQKYRQGSVHRSPESIMSTVLYTVQKRGGGLYTQVPGEYHEHSVYNVHCTDGYNLSS